VRLTLEELQLTPDPSSPAVFARITNASIIIISSSIIFFIIIYYYYYYYMRLLAQSRRQKLSNYGWIWLSLRFERALKRDCICLLDGNGKTLKEVNGLEWITRDSCCASANFSGKLNGLSIPRTRSLNNKWYENLSRRKIRIFD